MILDGLFDHVVQGRFEILRLFQPVGIDFQGFRHGGVEHDIGAGDAVRGTHHAEFKLIAGEGKGRGAVPVGGIPGELGQHMHAQLHHRLLRTAVGRVRLDGFQNGGQFVAQEHGYHGGRRFVGPQTMVVAGRRHGKPQQILIIVHRLNDRAQKQQELGVFIGGFAGRQKVHAGIGGHGPVIMFAGAVHAGKGLFVQQAHQPVAGGHLAHDLHGQLVMVGGHVGGGVNRGQFMLSGSHFVMLRFGQHTKLPQFFVQIRHISRYPGLDYAEIVIVQFLSLGGLCAEKRAAAEHQILALFEHVLIHQEILLFRAHAGAHTLDFRIAEEPQNAHGLLVQGLHGAQQGGFLVQGLAAIGTEGRGNAQGLILNEGVGGGIPGGIAPGLEGGPQAAGGE